MAEKKTVKKAKKSTVKAKGKANDPKAAMKEKKAADTMASKASKLAAKRGLDTSPNNAKDGNKAKNSPNAKKQAPVSPGRIIIQVNLRPGQQQQKPKVVVNKPKVNKPKPEQQQPARKVIVQGVAGKKKKGKK